MPSDDDRMLRSHLLADDVLDMEFDELLSPVAKARSREFWTPVWVARRAAARFAERGVRRVLDVGSGPGKFCIVAASAQPELEFCGIEQREQLVESANDLAQRLHVGNSEFSVGDALAASWHSLVGFTFSTRSPRTHTPRGMFSTEQSSSPKLDSQATSFARCSSCPRFSLVP
jgi:Methyltransferase domain